MDKRAPPGPLTTSLGELAKYLGGQLEGPSDLVVHRVTSTDRGDSAGIAFAESPKFIAEAKASGVAALLIGLDADPLGLPAIRVADPRRSFFGLLQKSIQPLPISSGIHPTAVIDPAAVVDASARVGPFAVVEAGAVIEANAKVYAFAYIGQDCQVCTNAVVGPHAVLLQDVTLGAGSVLQAGSVLGGDGFGFVWDGQQQLKIPQVGRVTIGENVEIGVLSAVDRAMAGETTIGRGTKLDNHVQIGHNCHIGAHGAIAAMSAIGGSCVIGDRVLVGGATAFKDHVTVVDDVALAGRSGVMDDLREPGPYFGLPARPAAGALKNLAIVGKLSEFVSRLRKMESRITALEHEGADAS